MLKTSESHKNFAGSPPFLRRPLFVQQQIHPLYKLWSAVTTLPLYKLLYCMCLQQLLDVFYCFWQVTFAILTNYRLGNQLFATTQYGALCRKVHRWLCDAYHVPKLPNSCRDWCWRPLTTEQYVYILSDAMVDREGTNINELDIKIRVVERSPSFVNAVQICFLHLALQLTDPGWANTSSISHCGRYSTSCNRPADADYGEL